MQINKNRKGLALGAVFALVTSFFAGAAPASANTDGQYIALTPAAGTVTNFNGVLYEDFPLTAYLLPGVDNTQFASGKAIFEVTKTSGALEVIVSASAAAQSITGSDADAASASAGTPVSFSGLIEASSSTPVTFAAIVDGTTKAAFFNMKAYTASPGLVSSSPNVTLQIKVWVENLATTNGKHDPLEWYTTKTVTLHSANSVPAVTTIVAPKPGDSVLTVSSVVSALNFANLGGSFFLQVNSTNNQLVDSSDPSATISSAVSGANAALRAGVISQSFAISTSALAGTSFSAHVRFHSSAALNGGFQLGASTSAVVAGTKAGSLAVAVVTSSNAVQASNATVRANQTYTFRVTATSGSPSVSVSGAVVSVKLSSSAALSLNVKEISVNGAASTTSWPTAIALTTGTDGTATFTLATSGFAGSETFEVIATEQNVSTSLTVNVEGTKNSVTADYSQIAMAPGTTTPITFSIKDQFKQSSTATNLRLKVTKGGATGFSYTDTVSYVSVVGGKATFNFTPTPATKTGSATVAVELQELQAASGAYVAVSPSSTATVNVNVSGTADKFGTGLKASYSSSVSYFPSTLAAAVAVSGKVANTGSAVVISGAGLVFEDASGDTYSDTVTVRADGTLAYSVKVYGTKAGTYTLTLVNGSASTTSQFIVDAAAHDSGHAISFDTSTIEAGKTRIVTGKVVDMNGNPVNTTAGAGTASILVTFAGTAGIPVGAMPTETNADGEFQVSILTSASDRGTFTLTATYLKAGASTAVKDRISSVQTIAVGAGTSVPTADQKLTVGSFKGYVAIYTKNYTGSKLSAKVAGKWLTVENLASYSRTVRLTGAGYTIKVDLYIDGSFVRSETVVTK